MRQARGCSFLFLGSSSPIRKNPKSQAQTKKKTNPLAAMHVLVNPLEIVPGRCGPPALRSRIPSTSRHCVLSRSSGLRALKRKFRRKVLMATVQAHRRAVSREELVKALLFATHKKLRAKIWSKLRRWLAARGLESRVNKLAARGLGGLHGFILTDSSLLV